MRQVFGLFADGMKTRWVSFAILCLQVLVATLVVAQGLVVVGNLVSASDRLSAFAPLDGWYQLTDTTDPAAFQQLSSAPDFAPRLARLYEWIGSNRDIDLLVLPKTSAATTTPTGQQLDVFMTSLNLASCYDLRLARGRWLDAGTDRDMRPVVLGAELGNGHAVGERIAEGYYLAGVLEPGSTCYDIGAGMQPIDLDGMALTPPAPVAGDAGTLDGVLNAPIVRFRTPSAKRDLQRMTGSLGLYRYRFWRLDDFLRYHAADLRAQIALEAGAAAVILGFALSAFLLGMLRSISTRRREFGIHLAYGAGHVHFWGATSLEFALVVTLSCAVPLAVLHPPYWEAAALAFLALSMALAFVPAATLARRSIPDLMRGTD